MPPNHSIEFNSCTINFKFPPCWGLSPLPTKINVVFLKSNKYQILCLDLQAFLPIIKVCTFLTLQGNIWVTTVHFTNFIVIGTCNINHKPMEIWFRQASAHHLFIYTSPKQVLGFKVFCFHLTQNDGQQTTTKIDHTHVPPLLSNDALSWHDQTSPKKLLDLLLSFFSPILPHFQNHVWTF